MGNSNIFNRPIASKLFFTALASATAVAVIGTYTQTNSFGDAMISGVTGVLAFGATKSYLDQSGRQT